MANPEMQLVSRIVRTGDLSVVLDWGITDADFRTNEAKSVFRYVAGYYADAKTRGSVLGERVFADVFPQLQLYDDHSMTTAALCHEVRRGRIIGEAREAVLALTENVEVDPIASMAALNVQIQTLLALGEAKNHDLFASAAVDGLLDRYMKVKNNQFAFARMPWPWEIMNEVTGGIQEDDFIVAFGRPKNMKTWVLVYILAWAYINGKTALVYTKEMTPENIYQRVFACIARIPYQELRSGKLLPEDELSLTSTASVIRDKYNNTSNIIVLDGRSVGAGGDTVAWLQSKAEKYKPDIIFIDGMYLLSDAGGGKKTADWQRVTNISRAVRQMILHLRVPVVATMQANRAAAKNSDANLDEIAYADAIAQDATVIMRTIENKKDRKINLIMGGSREFRLHGIRINGIPATNFEFDSIMTEQETEEAKKAEAAEAEGKKKAAKRPRTRTDEAPSEQEKMAQRQVAGMQ
jgi:hypothetical protein